ncbi:MAG TPA: PqqD family protein [Planctomycetota bacterium]|nr:PqqD family protein [Planctomycetota bacterium]
MNMRCLKTKHVVWEELDGQTLLIDSRDDSAWLLNESAAQIWMRCEAESVEQIARQLARATRERLAQIEEDVCGFIDALRARGWVRRAQTAGEGMAAEELAFESNYSAPRLKLFSLASGPRRRPSPRGNSGPG